MNPNKFADCMIAVTNTNSKAGYNFSINPYAAKGRNEFNPNPMIPAKIIIHTSDT